MLVEFDREDDVVCFLTSSQGKVSQCKLRSKSNIPVVFSFSDLDPKQLYKVSLSCKLSVNSSFWTLRENSDNPGDLNVAVISCNEISMNFERLKDGDLWIDLQHRVEKHEFDYLFHIGDQCYQDMGHLGETNEDPYRICKFILDSTPKDLWEFKKPILLEVLRTKYRRTWSYYPIACTLANIPNTTILDDHEARDDWGFRPEDYTPGTFDHFYGQLARQVYYEYERQLREDIDWNNFQALNSEYYDLVVHGVGISLIEYRACRTWAREKALEETYLGENQTAWVDSLYKKGGKFDNVAVALFMTPMPLIYLSPVMTRLFARKENDVHEHWSFCSDKPMGELLDKLRDWKERRSGRELTIVGGDVHLGGYTEIFHQGKPMFKQLTSSPINGSNGLGKWILAAQRLAYLNNSYSYKHYDWTEDNNYGIIKTKVENNIATVTSQLISIKDNRIFERRIDRSGEFRPIKASGIFSTLRKLLRL